MIIKKFQGKTEEEAVEAAKKVLGTNVVIMNVKNVKKKGFFSFLKSMIVEVTVALEEESEKNPPKIREIKEVEKSPLQGTALHEILSNGEFTRQDSAGKAIEEKLENLQAFLTQKLLLSEEEKTTEEATEEPSELMVFMRLLYNTMIDNEVSEKFANQIIDEIEKNCKPNIPFDYALTNIYQKMILKFEQPSLILPAVTGPKVIFFIGPTGVGKTTTIAKIASRFCVEEKKKVALLTADTYRIAAAEQLRTYANILGTPFRIIYSTEEMVHILEELKEYDYIMVDTAGHSHHNAEQTENMNQFIHSVDHLAEKEVYLVLSATTKYRDLINIADTYSAMTGFKLIFTKLDETTSLGNLLNLKLYTGAAMSYVTCGQNVPDDIEMFDPQGTVKQLLGGNR